jgi:benzoyl-CoA reductase/2-hydroxyglutaryl-CoA dehydratase subunit BcrC/BadD/HgdB
MNTQELLTKFHDIASNPNKQKENYLTSGKKVVLTAPIYTPDEIIHSMGMVPMGVWGADIELKDSKSYFPAFICSIMQSVLDLGMKGTYEGASAIIIPSLCDSLKVLGENWKYAITSIPFIPMTYPQNRKPAYAAKFTRAGYERIIKDLEKVTQITFDEKSLDKSIEIYNEHNAVMREMTEVLAQHAEVSAAQRSDIFKSAFFMLKEEHTVLVKELIKSLKEDAPVNSKVKVMTTGILADSPNLLKIIDEMGFQIVVDDVAAESRQYRTDVTDLGKGLDSLADKFSNMDNCSVLYDAKKKRVDMIVEDAIKYGAEGVIVVLTKFCDPEEFDYPLIKRACEAASLPIILIEVDRQMGNFEQARTMVETFKAMLDDKK